MRILLCMIMVMPFEKNPHLMLHPGFLGGFTVIKLLGLCGLAWVLFEVASGRVSLALFRAPQAKALWLFVAMLTASSLAGGTGFIPVMRSVATVSLLTLVVAAVRSEDGLRRALKAVTLMMILVFPYGYRHMLQYGTRFGSGLSEANYFALALVLLIALAFVFARQEATRARKLLWMGGLGVLLVELILTGSRGGFVGAVIVLSLLVVRLVRRRGVALGVMALGLGLLVAIPNPLGTRLLASGIDSSVHDAGAERSTASRLSLIKAGLRMVRAHPLIGVGVGRFKSESMAYGAAVPKIAHNTYLELAAELGIPALFAFLNVYLVTFLSLSRSRRYALAAGRRDLAELASAVAIGIAGYAASATFLSAYFENFFWLVVFLSICLERVSAALTVQAERGGVRRPPPRSAYPKTPERARERSAVPG